MEIFLGLTLFFLLVFVAFMAFTFFLPEWVGITGDKAKEVMKEQSSEETTSPPKEP